MRQPSKTSTDTSPTAELRRPPPSTRSEPTQEKAKDLEPEPIPGVRARYVVSAVHLTHRDSAQPLARNAINVEIRIILVPNVGPNSWEEETDDLAAHPEDVRTRININSPGREVTRGPKVRIVLSQPPFKTIQVTSMEKTQTSMEIVQTSMDSKPETSMEPKVLNS